MRIAISILIIVSLSLFSNKAMAQRNDKPFTQLDYDYGKPFHFGFSLGFNFMDFTIKNNGKPQEIGLGDTTALWADASGMVPGFNVNIITDYRLNEYFSVRCLPGLSFGQRDLKYYEPSGKLLTTMNLESSFIEVPILIKYKAKRSGDIRPYLIAGINPRFDVAAYKKLNNKEGIYVRLNSSDVYYEFGAGLDFYLTYFKFSIEMKYSAGISNVLSPDLVEGGESYVKALDKIQSQLFVIAFHFE
ncbi:type IX secretion/gliding motility protein PorT/SprT [Williamwhitmania taraxaci]|nr:porin family protein [Williamwhitmania taraxaci]